MVLEALWELKMAVDDVNINTENTGDVLAGSDLEKQAEAAAIEKAQIEASKKQPIVSQQLSSSSQGGGEGAGITNADLFPGMNQPINVGTSSSKTLGSQPIFVASGQYVPFNVLNKREEAINKAAQKRLERQLKFDPGSAAKLNNALYQPALNEQFSKTYNQFKNEAQANYGQDWDLYLGSPSTEIGQRFLTAKRNLNVLADQGNEVFGKVAEIMASKEKGGKTLYSPETIQAAYDIQNKVGEFENGGVPDLVEAKRNFDATYDLDAYIKDNDVIKSMKADIESTIINNPNNEYVINEKRESYRQRIEELAESLTSDGQRYEDDDLITKDVIKKRLGAYLGIEDKVTKSVSMKRQESTYDKKGKKEEEASNERAKRLKAMTRDTKSELGQQMLGNLVGTKDGTNVINDAQYIHPEDYESQKTKASELIKSFNDSRTEDVGAWIPGDSKFSAAGAEAINKFLKENGSKSTVNKVDVVKGKDGYKDSKVFVIKDDFQDLKIDAGTEQGMTDLENYLIDKIHGKGASSFKDKTTIKLKESKGDISFDRFVDVSLPSTWSFLNGLLNQSSGEDLDVKQEQVDKLKEDNASEENGFSYYQTTDEYKNNYNAVKKAKADWSEEKIKQYIENQYLRATNTK